MGTYESNKSIYVVVFRPNWTYVEGREYKHPHYSKQPTQASMHRGYAVFAWVRIQRVHRVTDDCFCFAACAKKLLDLRPLLALRGVCLLSKSGMSRHIGLFFGVGGGRFDAWIVTIPFLCFTLTEAGGVLDLYEFN